MSGVRRIVARVALVSVLLAGSLLAVVTGGAPAGAVTCATTNYKWVSGTRKVFKPGTFCVKMRRYELLFGVEGALILYGNGSKKVWQTKTLNRGTRLVLGRKGLVEIDGCNSEACTKIVRLWDSVDTADKAGMFDHFMIQIGVGGQSFNACWSLAAHDKQFHRWYGADRAWPGSAGLCTGTYAAGGGGGGGYDPGPV